MGRLATSERRNRALCTLNPLSPPFRTHPPPFLRLFAAAYTAVPRGNLMPSPRGLFIPSGICWHVRDATAATLSAAGGYWYQLGPESLSPEGIGYYFSMRRAPPSPHHSSWPSSPHSGFASLLHPPFIGEVGWRSSYFPTTGHVRDATVREALCFYFATRIAFRRQNLETAGIELADFR